MFVLKDFLRRLSRCAIMGIVNSTGDSFSEGRDSSPDLAVARGLALAKGGADILDIGGESTRPGAENLSVNVELARVIPVVESLKRLLPEMIFSIDTRHREVAEAAVECGVQIINDVSMLREAPEIAGIAARHQVSLILNHSRAIPGVMQSEEYCRYPDGVAAGVAAELAKAKAFALASGVPEDRIVLDPGIGFAKSAAQCWEMLTELDKIAPLPELAVGVSRKSFLGKLTGESNPAERKGETLAIELELAAMGVGIIRTHGVAELVNAIKTVTYFRSLRQK
ncbi:MAG: dihydropteroate synthase [Lentisphaeria bacterium]|nr:dihydropteroate synthase [Lentisphaeria bacterium]